MEQAHRPIRDLVSLGGHQNVHDGALVFLLVDMRAVVLPFIQAFPSFMVMSMLDSMIGLGLSL
jgi:hypothetical protein